MIMSKQPKTRTEEELYAESSDRNQTFSGLRI